jgi:integrase
VIAGFTADAAKNAMRKACENAGIVHRHPHHLRHRYASLKIGEGVHEPLDSDSWLAQVLDVERASAARLSPEDERDTASSY